MENKKRVNLLKSIENMLLVGMILAISFTYILDNEYIIFIAIIIYGISMWKIENIKRNIVLKNTLELEGEIVKWNINMGKQFYTIEYDVDGIKYKDTFAMNRLTDIMTEQEIDNLKIGDKVKVYVSKDMPEYMLISLEESNSSKILAIVSIIVVVFLIIINILRLY